MAPAAIAGHLQTPRWGTPGNYPTEPSAVGWAQGHAVFRMAINASENLLMVSPETGQWQWATDPPQTDGACATGGEPIAVDTGVLNGQGRGISPDPEAAGKPLRTQRYDAQANAWSEVSAIPKPESSNSIFEKMICTADRVAYLPVKNPPDGLDRGGLWFDPANLQWDPLLSFEKSGFPGPMLVAETAGTKVLLIGTTEMRVLPAGTDTWLSVRSPVPAGLTGLRAMDAVVLMTGDDASGQVALGLLQPERFSREEGRQPTPTTKPSPTEPLVPAGPLGSPGATAPAPP